MAQQTTSNGGTSIIETPREKVTAMTVRDRGVQLTTFQEMTDFAKIVVASGLAPKEIDTPQKAFMVLQEGMELGLSPMQSLKGIAVIYGRTYVWGDHIVAVCMANPHFDHKRFKQVWTGKSGSDDFTAICECARVGGNTVRLEFSWKNAVDGGLVAKNDNYKKHPATMLMRRATMRAMRMAFADILTGVRCAEFQPEGGGIDESEPAEAANQDGVASEPKSGAEEFASIPAPTRPAPVVHEDPFDRDEPATNDKEAGRLPLSATASDADILEALDRFTKQLASENEWPLTQACESVLKFRYTRRGETEPTEDKVSNIGWFTAERTEAKRAARMKIARSIASDLESSKDPRFVIEKAAA